MSAERARPERAAQAEAWDEGYAVAYAAAGTDEWVGPEHENPYRRDLPPRPELGQDEDGFPTVPEGWDFVLLGTDAVTGQTHPIAGVTDAGVFVQWATTEEIVTVCRQALDEAMSR